MTLLLLAVEEVRIEEDAWPGPLGSAYATTADLDFRAEEPPAYSENDLQYQLQSLKHERHMQPKQPTSQVSLCHQVCSA